MQSHRYSRADGLWPDSHVPVSARTISAKTDAALDKQFPTNGHVEPGLPKVEDDREMRDVEASANGIKRKASGRKPNYAESESSDDDLPLVRNSPPQEMQRK